MTIKKATVDDLYSVLSMINQMYQELGYGSEFSEEKILQRLKSRLFINLIAIYENNPIGFSTVKIMPDEYGDGGSMAFLYELYISPSFRKKGFASAILATMEKEILELGILNVELYVHINNTAGFNFWKESGFITKYHVLRKKLG